MRRAEFEGFKSQHATEAVANIVELLALIGVWQCDVGVLA
jgi:hypothetical protein